MPPKLNSILAVKDTELHNFLSYLSPSVVYLDQHLGAVHSKHWSKYAFFMFFT